MKTFILPILAFFFLSTTTFSQTTPIRSDFQIWNDTSITIPLKKSTDGNGKAFDRLTFSVNGTLRFGRDASRPVDERIGVSFNYRLNKYVSLSPETLYRGYQPFKGSKSFESQLRFSVILNKNWKRFSLNDRNQIEYRLRNSAKNSVRYKNRLRLNVPINRNGKEIFTPFVSDEPYYDFQAKTWTRNELFAGFGKKFNKSFSADFFYLFVKDKGFPKTVNGIGVSFKFRID